MRRITVDVEALRWAPPPVGPKSAEQRKLESYLLSCPVVLTARMRRRDRIDSGAPPIEVVYRSDGEWTWSHEAATYVIRYGAPLPREFVERVLGGAQPPLRLSSEQRRRALSAF